MQREEQVQKPGGHSGVSAFKMEDVFWDWEEKAGLMVSCTMFLVGGPQFVFLSSRRENSNHCPDRMIFVM